MGLAIGVNPVWDKSQFRKWLHEAWQQAGVALG